MVKTTFDYIVVGAGSAGCAMAYRLAQVPDCRVLVLEAGSWDRSPYLRIPAGRMRMSDRYDWSYPAEPDASRHGNAESWESGKVTGGTSTINGMIWVRGAPEDYDGWAALGCRGWDFDSLLPYFRRAETFEGGADSYRGGSGPQHVSYVHSHHPLTEVFVEAAKAAGFPFNQDYNGREPAGVAYGQVAQRRGLRHSTARAYLRPAARRRNVKVVTKAFARRVILDRGRAVGVEYEHHGRTGVARCRGEVIVSAGAIGSPKLLMMSGIGPADHLMSVGVVPTVALPGVGHNLQNHLGISMIHQVDVPTLNREITPANVLKQGLDLVLHGRGTATAAAGHAVVFGSVSGSGGIDFEATFSPFGRFTSKPNGEGRSRHKLSVDATNAVTVRVGLTHPRSRGQIMLRSADPDAPPRVVHEMASDPGDLADLAAACRLLREVLATEPMKRHIVRELKPGDDVQTGAQWAAVIRRIGGSKHTAGTCAMGVGELSVADPRLRVRGVDGLRVADLSVTPVIPSGNTNAAAIMIGERGADLVLEDAGWTHGRDPGVTRAADGRQIAASSEASAIESCGG
jgi:choline dehydrogenase